MNTTYKKIFTVIAFLSASIGLLTGCKDDEGFDDVSVTAVGQFYEPANSRYVVLNSDGSMYFEWERARAADNSIVYYDVLFEKEGGDFSNPIYTLPSDKKGVSSGATVTHVTLNKIAGLAGIDFAAEGKLKWTVRASRGMNLVVSGESREFTVVRINSVEELQGPLYITGEGSEDGQKFKATGEGTYEIYTGLEAGKPYYFYSPLGSARREFVIHEDGKFKETAETPQAITVSATGAYRIRLNFQAAASSIEKLDKLELVVSWTQRRTEIPYFSKGVWKLEDYNVQLATAPWGFDERYKIVFTIDGKEEHWEQLAVPHFDPRPPINMAGYRDMKRADDNETDQWGGSQFKFPNELCDGGNLSKYTADVTVSMTADKKYTHDFTNITP